MPAAFLFVLFLSGCAISRGRSPIQTAVGEIHQIQANLLVPITSYERGVWNGGSFDTNTYFQVLDGLSMEPGYTLDYIYVKCGLGGMPILYARKREEKPFASYDSFMKARNHDGGPPDPVHTAVLGSLDKEREDLPSCWFDWLQHVKADGTPASYLQFAVLKVMGPHFYLYWHARYNDLRPVCSQRALGRIKREIERPPIMKKLPPSFWHNAKALDLTPTVSVHDELVEISMVLFSKWGGFYRWDSVFRREFPHETLEEHRRELLAYDVMILY